MLTFKDAMAAAALTGLLAKEEYDLTGDGVFDKERISKIAKTAYAIADEMLKQKR